jgi:hypothetical protein
LYSPDFGLQEIMNEVIYSKQSLDGLNKPATIASSLQDERVRHRFSSCGAIFSDSMAEVFASCSQWF